MIAVPERYVLHQAASSNLGVTEVLIVVHEQAAAGRGQVPPTESVPATGRRIELPLVHCRRPGSFDLRNERIGEILDEEDAGMSEGSR